jgi:hypothetical protein
MVVGPAPEVLEEENTTILSPGRNVWAAALEHLRFGPKIWQPIPVATSPPPGLYLLTLKD